MLTLFLQAGIIVFILVTLLWIWSVLIKNASIVDIFWGIGFVVVNTFYFLSNEHRDERHIIVLILVAIWGFRLAGYLAWRNIGKGEDFRYREFRRKFGPKRYWWLSYFQTFLLQGILIMIISLPLLAIQMNTANLSALDYVAIIIWGIGFLFEAGGDYQLAEFKNNSANKGKLLNTGFWKYTRHPNYFGDAVVWVSYALFSMAVGSYWPAIGTVIMILLLLKVSGVALLEETMKTSKPQYRNYMEKTNAFIPWFPKK